MSNKSKGGTMKKRIERSYLISFMELKQKFNIKEYVVAINPTKVNDKKKEYQERYGIEVIVK